MYPIGNQRQRDQAERCAYREHADGGIAAEMQFCKWTLEGKRKGMHSRVCATVVPVIGLEICWNLEMCRHFDERMVSNRWNDQIRWYRR